MAGLSLSYDNEHMGKRDRARAGSHADRMKFNRTLTQAVRDRITPDIFVDYYLAIAMGHGTTRIVEDARCEGGLRVTWSGKDGGGERDIESTLEERNAAMKQLEMRGYGQFVQQVILDAEMRTMSLVVGAGLNADAVLALPPAARSEIMTLIERALRKGVGDPDTPALPSATTPNDNVQDAEYRDLPAEPSEESAPDTCLVPPAGWYCTRVAGHDGPCAAFPLDTPNDGDPPSGTPSGVLGL